MLAYRSLCYKIYESRFTVIFPFAPPPPPPPPQHCNFFETLVKIMAAYTESNNQYSYHWLNNYSTTFHNRVYLYWKETEIYFVETMFVNKYMYVQI